MRRILVGFDGSDSALAALQWAVAEARLHDASLEVWTVLEPPPLGFPHKGGDDAVILKELRSAAIEITSDIAAAFRAGHGGAAAELCAACAASDLLVVGSRGRSPFTGLLLGSVSRACLQHAPCSVVVVHGTAGPTAPHGRVVVGLDTSGDSRHALRVAAEEARIRGAALEAVHAVHWDHLGVELIEPTTQELITWGNKLVRTELAGSGVAAQAVVPRGNPSDVLVRHSANADLLVLGSRGHSALTALAVGSTSDYCARHAACPVLIVRPEHQDSA